MRNRAEVLYIYVISCGNHRDQEGRKFSVNTTVAFLAQKSRMMTALLYLAYNCRPELGDQSADEIFAGEPRIERMLLTALWLWRLEPAQGSFPLKESRHLRCGPRTGIADCNRGCSLRIHCRWHVDCG